MGERRRPEVRVLIVVLCAVVAIAGFAALAAEVREGDIFAIDRTLLLAFRTPGHLGTAIGPRWLQEAARDISALGGFTVLTLVTVISALLLYLHRRAAQAAVFLASVVFAQMAAEVVKALIDRPRPTLVPHNDLVYSASFPSGHAVMTPVVYLTLATVVAALEHRRHLKAILPICAALLVLAVGISRVYLGVHWPTDVLAGWALGIAIALAASMVLRRVAPRADGQVGAVQGNE
jgi:undecaprenyl-diphosphatase